MVPDSSSPRTRELVERWRRETPGDMAFIQRVLSYFNEEAFHYSLESPLLGNQPVDEFLFDTRVGYCEHYSSAFAVLMRLAGIPARIVTGYQGGWFNEFGNYLLVRQSNAHAWVEIWLPNSGWTRVDPTASVSPARIQQGPLSALGAPRHLLDFDWLRELRNGSDILQQRWNEWVIEYGTSRQKTLFSPLGMDRLTASQLLLILFLVTGFLSVVLIPLVLRVRGPGRKDPVQRVWQKFLRRLKSAGFETLPSSGAMELAEAASVRLPLHSESIYRIAGLYTRSRYAPVPPPLHDLKQAVREFRPGARTG